MAFIRCDYIERGTIVFAPDNPASVSAGQPFNLTFFAIDNMGVVPGVQVALTGMDRGPASGVTNGCGQCTLKGFGFLEPGRRTIRARAVIGGVPVHAGHRVTVIAEEAANADA